MTRASTLQPFQPMKAFVALLLFVAALDAAADPATNAPGAYFAPPLRPGSSHRAIASLGDPRRAATA